jgi:DMSO reductase anchor subunit
MMMKNMVMAMVIMKIEGAGEMAQRLRALTALPKVLSSNLSNHMVAHNHP